MKRIFLIAVLFVVSGCAPGLSKSVEISQIPEAKSLKSGWSGLTVSVDPFNDSRGNLESVKVGERHVALKGDFATILKASFEEAVKAAGGGFCLFDCPKIVGDLIDVGADIKSGFPTSTLNAHAKIRIRVMDPKAPNKRTLEYRGTVTGEHPMYTESKIEEEIGRALTECIEAAVLDPKLKELISR